MAVMRSTTLVVILAITMVLMIISCPSKADTLEFDIAPDNGLAPDSDIIYGPEPTSDPGLMLCASKVTLDCATQIMDNDFFAVHFEAKCCRQLIRMGKKCNDLIVDYMLDNFGMKDKYARMHNRSDHLWNKCIDVLSS